MSINVIHIDSQTDKQNIPLILPFQIEETITSSSQRKIKLNTKGRKLNEKDITFKNIQRWSCDVMR